MSCYLHFLADYDPFLTGTPLENPCEARRSSPTYGD
ncbi:hypothetical protein CCACVL1_19296 [Corchorus capsularis]|uniref:Uncharacterized protein n=1 Tax=Corchorus capsularis TaxID=210143 RepID=A0A1R3HH91_COCAP|nr:hypothetical protein CCACVL1_19296 [Corchorus capsularis]